MFFCIAEQHFQELDAAFVPQPDWKTRYFEKSTCNADLFLYWIMANGEHAGFMLFGTENHGLLPRKNGVIYKVYILPAHRQNGVASACAQWAIRGLKALFPAKIELEVIVHNSGAMEMWKSLGFRKVTNRFVLDNPS